MSRAGLDFAQLVRGLDLAVFDAGRGAEPLAALSLLGEPPAWLDAVCPRESWVGDGLDDALPFLANFLVDAAEFWGGDPVQGDAGRDDPGPRGRVSSGPWTEEGVDGELHTLEAFALVAQGRRILCVERLGEDHVERQRVLQRARETDLDRGRLARAERQIAAMHAELDARHRDLTYVFERLALGSAVLDAEGRVGFLSQAAAGWLGVSAEEALGQEWSALFEARTDVAAELGARRVQAGSGPRVAARLGARSLEVDVQADPRSPDGRIVFVYDRTEVQELRSALAGQARFEQLLGKSLAMRQVYELIDDLAPYTTTVLIEGETGTGKELVARALHTRSPRKDGPFVAVNCAGFTESLLSSQLFGHRRGSFTGASADHVGYFEAASGGSLFLDEIGDIPLEVQTRILRVLQEREVTRVGENEPRAIDVRVVCATHKSLAEEVEAGRFRKDLLYRIRVGRVQLPALLERREDIPLLAEAFLQQITSELGKPLRSIDADAIGLMLDYAWPGNVRELRSAIEFGVVRAKADSLRAGDLPPEVLELAPLAHMASGDADEADEERRKILAALRSAGGNRSAAAKLLGVSRATFYRRLVRFGDDPEL